MSDNKEIWAHDSLEIDDDGYVIGSAYTDMKLNGHYMSVGVSSYEYKRRGEVKMNHVPLITVADDTGKVVAEPTSHDSSDPEKAIENAKSTGEYVFENLEEFVG